MTFELGATASLTRTITNEDISAFAALSGDTNPIHLDDSFAEATRFGKRIAHGMLTASLISAVLGTILPGPGGVYLKQTLNFVAPVYPGDTIAARATVTSIRNDKPVVTLATVCENQNGATVLHGEAVVLIS